MKAQKSNENLAIEKEIYEQNCSIARFFIEEQLGLAPTPERIQKCVDFIVGLEAEE